MQHPSFPTDVLPLTCNTVIPYPLIASFHADDKVLLRGSVAVLHIWHVRLMFLFKVIYVLQHKVMTATSQQR